MNVFGKKKEKEKTEDSLIATEANSWESRADVFCKREKAGWKSGVELEPFP